MTVTCSPSSETDCSDNIDNDGDGDIDCNDIDCLGEPSCPEVDCTDGIDNDADAQTDCNDPACFGTGLAGIFSRVFALRLPAGAFFYEIMTSLETLDM